ncbi:allophanate hydrolase subunit 1 [Vibrio sp. T187]|uniref:5-oxoprolinase subunit B family protein n=1 Tax=Vibrio TaxID=662 RepID=UPI0010C9A606|nr:MULTISPECIES: carboxyltransferase domain-containing protein [Vibrio]MBW3696269.1 allophanate hydrolase subunit 1 [Vibrio sp. T187]
MNKERFSIEPIAECSILLRFLAEVNAENSMLIGALATDIRKRFGAMIMNVTPSYNSILVDYLPYRINESSFVSQLRQLSHEFSFNSQSHSVKTTTLPAYYSRETALDFSRFETKGINLDELIEIHTSQTYSVSAIGFSPGFAFLSDVSDKISMPRLTTPRLSVPKGSIGIADSKTAVYPSQSPAGWNIIGNCPIPLFDLTRANQHSADSISVFSIGDSVKFEAIDYPTYLALGGEEL